MCYPVSVNLPLAFEISTWMCVCVRRRDRLGVRTRLRANLCWWKITPSGGELCLIEMIIRVGLLTIWGLFGALMEAVT